MYHLQLIKYGVYGVYIYSYKNLGTRTLVRNVISILTLFLAKTDSTYIIFTCSAFSKNVKTPCSSMQLCHLQRPPAFPVLCDLRVSVDPGSYLRGQEKIQILRGPSKKKNKYKIRSSGNMFLELKRSQQFMWALEIQIPFFWHLFIQFTRNAYIKMLSVWKLASPPYIEHSTTPRSHSQPAPQVSDPKA